MYHFFDAITNTKGDALTGYYVRVVDDSDNGVALYADNNLTPIVSTSGIADAAKVDADGNADFYVAVGTYRLDIYATDSTTLVKSISDVGMNIDVDTAASAAAAQALATSSAAAAASSAGAAATSALAAAASASIVGEAATSATAAEAAEAGVIAALSGTSLASANISVASRSLLAAATHSAGLPAILTESGREGVFVWSSADHSATVTTDTAQGIYVAPSSDTSGASGAWVRQSAGAANAKWFGSAGDGATDDTAALTAALAVVDFVHIPAGTFIVSALSIPANKVISTAGHDTIIKQKPGTAANTRILSVIGSNVRIGDISVEGQLNQAGDTTGEQNIGVFIQSNATNGNLDNISIGNIKGTNIRGDVVYIGASTGYTVKRVTVGKVYGTNVYRNIATVAGGVFGINIEHIDGEQVGLYHYDHEPIAGNGPSKGSRIGYIRGRNISIVAPDAGSYIAAEHIGHFEYDPTIATSSPDYSIANPSVPTFTWPFPVQVRNVKSLEIETCNISGAPGAAFTQIYSGGELAQQFITGRKWTIANCCQTTGTNYVNGAKGITFLDLAELELTLGGTTHLGVSGCSNSRIGPVALTTPATPAASAALINNSDDTSLGPVKHVAGTGGSLISGSTNSVTINGGNFAGDRLLSNTTDAILFGVVSTATTTNSASTGHLFGCSLLGTKYPYRYESSTTPTAVAADGTFSVAGSARVLSARKTGWSVDTGTAKRTASATYTAGATLTYSSTYVQSEQTAMATRMAAVEAAVQNNSQTIKALKDDLHSTAGHGLIGT